jgi:hypothetical protein
MTTPPTPCSSSSLLNVTGLQRLYCAIYLLQTRDVSIVILTSSRTCKRRERQRPRTRSVRMEDDDHVVNLPKLDPEEKHEIPLKCIGWQCLTRDDLSLKDRQQKYKSKYSLQRHANRCRLNHFKPGEKMPCPDDHGCGVILESIMHFKSHAERVHDFCL